MYEIRLAAPTDFDGITALLQANSPSQGGKLAVEFSRDTVARMCARKSPITVAHCDGQVVGVLFSSAKEDAVAPVVQAMLSAWPGADSAYVYGPVCIADSERGQGLLPQLYSALRVYYPDREAILFIDRSNGASLRAHQKLDMREVAGFTLENVDYAVFSDKI